MTLSKKDYLRILKEEGLNKALCVRLWKGRPDNTSTESELRALARIFLEEERKATFASATRSGGEDFVFCCEVCSKEFARGRYAIVLEIRGEQLLVAEKPQRKCCGVELLIALTYNTAEEVERAIDTVIRRVQKVGNTSELRTLSFGWVLGQSDDAH